MSGYPIQQSDPVHSPADDGHGVPDVYTPAPAPTLTDAELLNRFQGLSASIALAGKRHGATMKPERDALRAELESRLAAARPAGVTLDPDQAETVLDIVTRYRDEVDESGLRPDLTGILVTMHMQLAARATADAAAEGGE